MYIFNNQPFITRPTLIDLYPHEHNQGLRHYSSMVSLDRCNERCNTLVVPCNN